MMIDVFKNGFHRRSELTDFIAIHDSVIKRYAYIHHVSDRNPVAYNYWFPNDGFRCHYCRLRMIDNWFRQY